MDQPIWQIKKDMCDVGHRIWLRGYCGGNEGNHSVRISEDRVLCTPTGISKGFLTPDDICVVDMDGTQVETNPKGRKRSSEVLMHLTIYKHRRDVGAVVHSHPPHPTAFAITNTPIPEGIHPEAEVFLGRIPMADYAVPSKPILGQSVIDHIGPETNTVIMGNHGTVSFDKDLIGAYYKLEILDGYCRLLILAKHVGKINVLNPQQMTELLEVKEKFGMKDDRLACAPDGCASPMDQPFLNYDVQPMSASCDCGGGEVTQRKTGSAASAAAPPPGVEPAQFETMVRAITDQIMAAAS